MKSKRAADEGRALWKTLALWMIPTVVFLITSGLFLTGQSLRDVADSAYDRSLSGAIHAIDLRISTQSGGVGVELPYPLFESFQATADGEVLFRVSTDDGMVQIGDALLPEPPQLRLNEVVFYDAVYFGRSIRVGAYMRALDPPLYGSKHSHLIIEVAETTGSREAFLHTVMTRTIMRDLAALLAATVFLGLGLHAGLRPLRTLRRRLDRRRPDDLRQVDPTGLPREVQPLVRSVNRLVDRHRLQGEAQRRFIEDASHQLKTPLAVLRAQIDTASRLNEPARLHDTHAAMREIVDRAARMTTQLLTLAHARNVGVWSDDALEDVDIFALLDAVVRLHVGSARQRRILLEVDDTVDAPVTARASEAMLFEALSNLVDNAINATPTGGRIVLSVRATKEKIVIAVVDSGPGLSAEHLERLGTGKRFNLAKGRSVISGGNGLGLAIVHQIMQAMGGTLVLSNEDGGGLRAELCLMAQKGESKLKGS